MGLEGVEIIMEVEEAFDITLDDAEAEKTVTPCDLIDAVALLPNPKDVGAQPGEPGDHLNGINS